jgi:hypothetical protein
LASLSNGWNGLFFSELVKYASKDRTGDAAAGLQFATLLGVAVLPAGFGFLVAATGRYFCSLSPLPEPQLLSRRFNLDGHYVADRRFFPSSARQLTCERDFSRYDRRI